MLITVVPAIVDGVEAKVDSVVSISTYANDVPVSNSVVDSSVVVPAALGVVAADSNMHTPYTILKQEKS